MAITHVLISRPEPECSDLRQRLRAQGLEAIEAPAFRFESRSFSVPATAWRRARHRLAVFTSPRAVRFALQGLPARFLDTAQIACVGPATANALEESGVPVDIQPEKAFTSESLLRMPALADAPGAAVVFAAPGGRRALIEGLMELGWQVFPVYVYERVPLEISPDAIQSIRQVESLLSIWTSASAMDRLIRRMPDDARAKVMGGPFVVVSERLARQARELGAADVRTADAPDNVSLASRACSVAAG